MKTKEYRLCGSHAAVAGLVQTVSSYAPHTHVRLASASARAAFGRVDSEDGASSLNLRPALSGCMFSALFQSILVRPG